MAGYTVYTSTYASGTGAINADETRTRYNGRLTLTTKRSLNVAPSAPGGEYVTLVTTEVSQGDGYAVYTYTWASGSGTIDQTTDVRSDGSSIYTVTSLNAAYAGSVPAGHLLANQDSEPGDGYLIFTQQYYKPPSDYTVPGLQIVTVPGLMTAGADGPSPSRASRVSPITTSIAVTFTTTPVVGAVTTVRGGCVLFERVNYENGDKLRKNTSFGGDYYAGAGATLTNGDYMGEPIDSAVLTLSGATDQLGQMITFNYDATPYFRSAGVTVYKQTVETGVLF